MLVSVSESRRNICEGNRALLGLLLFQLQGRRCNFNCLLSMVLSGIEKDANAFCTCCFYTKCQDQQISNYPDLATHFPVTGAQPSLSLSCSEKMVAFEEAILGNNSSQQITSLRKLRA